MKKVIGILLLVFLLTGCDVTYRLELIDNDFKEKISFSTVDEENQINTLRSLVPSVFNDVDHQAFYDKKIVSENPFQVDFDYTYRSNQYRVSPVLSACYDAYNVFHEKGMYYITTGNKFTCKTYDYQTADKVVIEFKTNHKVIETNADYKKKNTYYWEVDSTNMDHKPIMIKVSDQPEASTARSFSFPIELVAVVAFLAIVGIIVVIVIKNVSQKNNKL